METYTHTHTHAYKHLFKVILRNQAGAALGWNTPGLKRSFATKDDDELVINRGVRTGTADTALVRPIF